MIDFLEEIWKLERKKERYIQALREQPTATQIAYLNDKLAWEKSDKLRMDYFIETLETYHFDDEVRIGIWKNWLKVSMYHQFRRYSGIVRFLKENPQLKNDAINEIFHNIETNPCRVFTDTGLDIDDEPIFIAAMILWELNYKSALLQVIKNHKTICDSYFDEQDYLEIKNLIEQN